MSIATATSILDAILEGVVRSRPGVPGVAAVATDRHGDVYRGAAGVRSLDGIEPFTPDTVCAAFSTTKAITATACLALVDDGELDLDAPAADYVPDLGELQVLRGFDGDGRPLLRSPARPITTRMLLLHTAGFGYDFFNHDYLRLVTEQRVPTPIKGTRDALTTPLLFDPGDQWEYGTGIDWAGLVVEAITGQRLGRVLEQRIFAPLGMTSTSFSLDVDLEGGRVELADRLASMHRREDDGSLRTIDFRLPAEPEIQMGGHGLYTTALDYSRFIRMWLNDGMGPDGPVLRRETVDMAAADGLQGRKIHSLPGLVPAVTNDVEFFPGMPKSWGLSFMINDHDAPTGRPAGSLAWAGLGNLYFWIDRRNGTGGFWATQLFPFADSTSVGGYLAFETAVYDGMG